MENLNLISNFAEFKELRDNLEHYALSVQTDAREVAADKLTKYAVQLAEKENNDSI